MSEKALNWLCGELDVDKAELVSKRRFADLVSKRRVITCFFKFYGKSYPQIGEILKRDHSTIVNLRKKATDEENQRAFYLVGMWEIINAE